MLTAAPSRCVPSGIMPSAAGLCNVRLLSALHNILHLDTFMHLFGMGQQLSISYRFSDMVEYRRSTS